MGPKTPERYVRNVGRHIRALEFRLSQTIRSTLLAAFADIRDVLLRDLPDDGISRPLAYDALRHRLEDALIPLNDSLYALLSSELWLFQRDARLLASEWRGDPNAPPLSPSDLLGRLRWLRHRLDTYFQRRSPSIFMKEILRLVDRTVQRGLLQGTPTADIVADILPEMVRGGRRSLVIRRGTVVNVVRARVDAVIATAIWQTFTTISRDTWTTPTPTAESPTTAWLWSAILDPRTCPICAPLDGQLRTTPSAFPVQPPVHPNCRCILLPVTT